jgi:protein-S-isoprenylcysteine O-methyltransferase Ste14
MRPILICYILWAAFYVLWLVWALWLKQTERRDFGLAYHFHRVLVIVGFVLIFYRLPGRWLYRRLLTQALWLDVLGIVLTLAGFSFAIWARSYLGRNWSPGVTSKVQHELIRTGPYRWVRHPIYSGLLTAIFGTVLVQGEVRSVLALPLFYTGWKIKSHLEERMMTGTFGSAYTAYASSVGAIFPRMKKAIAGK